MEDQDLLRALLNGPWSHFKKFGQDDYRDPTEKNPPAVSVQKVL